MSKNLPVGKPEVDLSDESKYQPTDSSKPRDRYKLSGTPNHGVLGKFNEGGFGTNTKGSDYHDPHRPSSGLHGNFEQKDAEIRRLKSEAQAGQHIRHWTGNKLNDEMTTGNVGGMTAYNGNPIPETYQPGTSQGLPMRNGVWPSKSNPTSYADNNKIDSDSDAMKKRKK